MKIKKAKYDGKRELLLTDRYKAALIELLESEIEMMRKHDKMYADYWTWGEAEIGDMSSSQYLTLCFGGNDDKPKNMKAMSRIVIK